MDFRIFAQCSYMTRCHLKGALQYSTFVGADFSLFIREAHMLLEPSRHLLRVAMHNLQTSNVPALQAALAALLLHANFIIFATGMVRMMSGLSGELRICRLLRQASTCLS